MRQNGLKFIVAAALVASSLVYPIQANACVSCGAAKPGKGCDQKVTLKHPDLKSGPERRKEWKKCMADPAAYNG